MEKHPVNEAELLLLRRRMDAARAKLAEIALDVELDPVDLEVPD